MAYTVKVTTNAPLEILLVLSLHDYIPGLQGSPQQARILYSDHAKHMVTFN